MRPSKCRNFNNNISRYKVFSMCVCVRFIKTVEPVLLYYVISDDNKYTSYTDLKPIPLELPQYTNGGYGGTVFQFVKRTVHCVIVQARVAHKG